MKKTLNMGKLLLLFWGNYLFSLQRYKECIVVCEKSNYLRCKYIKAICYKKLSQYKESIDECLYIINEHFSANKAVSLPKNTSEPLYPKYALPNPNSVNSLLASFYK